ncbi:MAG: hypothetical protein KKF41_14475 [Actinobacteria bacterium]|nr:hypothetical protein [Actinomycetota bacterium]MBU1943756.1 hypothetical protein [Actinomycetota bacterium]MBU2688780.1 hypothetical protein [Actinomycetota bacterium]
MNSRERIEAAIRLEKPDRIPVVPIIDIFAARYAGVTQHDMLFDLAKADAAIEKTMADLGRMDGMNLSYGGMGRTLQLIFPSPPRIPGVDGYPADEMFQFVEKEVMRPEQYDDLIEQGALSWLLDMVVAHNPSVSGPVYARYALAKNMLDDFLIGRSARRWARRDFECLVGPNIVFTPMEFISLTLRSATAFTLDLFRRPEKVKGASRRLMALFKARGVRTVKITGVRRVFMGGTRTSATFLSPKLFEQLALPEWKELSEFFVERGITPVLHLDSEWTPFFEYLKELPARSCILNLDGTSDIFKAKEVLGDRMCIMGDVPATLLKLGEPEEVHAYCRRLIEELGSDGGFILSSGCTVPIDSKPENVKAMLESVHG